MKENVKEVTNLKQSESKIYETNRCVQTLRQFYKKEKTCKMLGIEINLKSRSWLVSLSGFLSYHRIRWQFFSSNSFSNSKLQSPQRVHRSLYWPPISFTWPYQASHFYCTAGTLIYFRLSEEVALILECSVTRTVGKESCIFFFDERHHHLKLRVDKCFLKNAFIFVLIGPT